MILSIISIHPEINAQTINRLAKKASPEVVAKNMYRGGKTAVQTATHLKTKMRQNSLQTSAVIKTVYGRLVNTPSKALDVLKGARYKAHDVFKALKAVHNTSSLQSAQLLKSKYNSSANNSVSILHSAGYTIPQIVTAMKSPPYSANPVTITKFLKSSTNASQLNIIRALKNNGYNRIEIYGGIFSSYRPNLETTLRNFRNAGYSFLQILDIFRTRNSGTFCQCNRAGHIRIIKRVGATAAEARAWLIHTGALPEGYMRDYRNIYGLAVNQVRSIGGQAQNLIGNHMSHENCTRNY